MAPNSRKKNMRHLMGTIKDKISLIRAAVLLSKCNTTSSYQVAVLRATTHDPSTSPPDYLIDDVLSLGHHSLPTASACVHALISRLHNTRNAYVALKCLFTIHNIITRGSSVFRQQISQYPLSSSSPSAANFLNLSNFRDDSDPDSWELSSWVRWYAGVIEQCLIASRSLGFFFSSKSEVAFLSQRIIDRKDRIMGVSSSELMRELGALVGVAEQIWRAPESLEYQRIGLIYEVMKLVGEDYRMTLREISIRVGELGDRVVMLGLEELTELMSELSRLEDCREKLMLIFLNKKRGDGVWDLISKVRVEAGLMKQRNESTRLVQFWSKV
ncbi:hypothetical protein Dimus_024981 [Dionaea muscipula]